MLEESLSKPNAASGPKRGASGSLRLTASQQLLEGHASDQAEFTPGAEAQSRMSEFSTHMENLNEKAKKRMSSSPWVSYALFSHCRTIASSFANGRRSSFDLPARRQSEDDASVAQDSNTEINFATTLTAT